MGPGVRGVAQSERRRSELARPKELGRSEVGGEPAWLGGRGVKDDVTGSPRPPFPPCVISVGDLDPPISREHPPHRQALANPPEDHTLPLLGNHR